MGLFITISVLRIRRSRIRGSRMIRRFWMVWGWSRYIWGRSGYIWSWVVT